MARPKGTNPLCWCDSEGQWVVYIGRKRARLGPDRNAAEIKRLRMIGASETANSGPLVLSGSLLLSEALELYRQHAHTHYTDSRTLGRIDRAIAATTSHAATEASSFRAKALRDVRAHLLTEIPALSRRYVNHLCAAIKAAFAWLASEELVPADTLASLRAVRALEAGRGGEERLPVPPADPDAVIATLPFLPLVVRDMVRLQLLLGCRPGELVRMHRDEISTQRDELVSIAGTGRTVAAIEVNGKPVWFYCPGKHKNKHRGKPRVIAIGPEAQAILIPCLMAGFLFRPVSERGCPVPGECYGVQSYSRAVRRAIKRAKRKGVAVAEWTPLGLRKTAAERAADVMDAESAGAMLGHAASKRALDSYVQSAIRRAAEAAAKCG